jgi:hypothetical protein
MKNMWKLQLFEIIERTGRIEQQLTTQNIYKNTLSQTAFSHSQSLNQLKIVSLILGNFLIFIFI